MSELTIYGAAYGPEDVTATVRGLRMDQKLSFTVSDKTFGGDPWHGYEKTLVVVYKYTCIDQVYTKIVVQGDDCTIHPPSPLQSAPITEDQLDSSDLEVIQQVSSRNMKDSGETLVILGAAYGKADVTDKANKKLTSNGEFNEKASNDVWGDSWKGHSKTMVVVYEYDGLQMLDVVKENERMHFIASPPITILGAAYGLADVTTKVCTLVKNRSLAVTANNDTFDNSWKGINKTLVVTYQYGEQTPKVTYAKQNEKLEIIYDKADDYTGSTNPDTLTILGAAFGPSDITKKTQEYAVEGNNIVQKEVNNTHFGPDPWKGVVKSLVVVYRYGRNPALMKIVPERSELSISKVVLPYVGLVDINALLDDGDILALGAVSGKYISCDSNNKLVAVQDVPNDECKMTMKKDSSSFFKIQCNNDKYVTVDVNLALYATSTTDDATKFSISVSMNGGLRLTANLDGGQMYVHLDSSDNSLKTTTIDQFGACTIFDLAFNQIGDRLSKYNNNLEMYNCGGAWAVFIWKLTGGFFLAIGLGPFITTGTINPGLSGLVESNPTAWQAVKELQQAITNGLGNTGALISSMLGVIGVLYYEDLLWTVLKLMLNLAGWTAVTWAVAKVIEVLFLPEAEAADLLASFAVWGVQTVEAGLAVGQACN